MKLNDLRNKIHENAIQHGWWDGPRSFGEIIALCHSELSEALEEYRSRKPMLYYKDLLSGLDFSEKDAGREMSDLLKPEGIAIELADTIIRILDYCGYANIDIEEAIRIKHEYNITRPWRHNGKIL